MNKKMIILVFVVLVIVSVGPVSAFDLFGSSDDSNNGDASFNGYKYNIPEGYNETGDDLVKNVTNSSDGVTYTYSQIAYQNSDLDTFVITYSHYEGINIDNDFISKIGGDLKTINTQDGYLEDMGGGFYTFSFPCNGDLVVISTNDLDNLNDVVI